jgi:hypothetical protein
MDPSTETNTYPSSPLNPVIHQPPWCIRHRLISANMSAITATTIDTRLSFLLKVHFTFGLSARQNATSLLAISNGTFPAL